MNRFSEQKFLVIGRPMRVTHNQEIPLAMSKKRQNGRRNSQETLCIPFPLVMEPIFAGRGRVISGRLANRLGTVDLEQTQNYCVELLVLYLRGMINLIQYSMM